MDITDALAPKSDQLDAIELVAPRTFTIDTGSRLGNRDGFAVVEVRLVGFDRVWRPSKGMLDAIVAIWGTDAKQWAGHSVTLYNDPEVTFGKDKVGGIRISHMTGIDQPRTVQIRGRGQGGKKVPWRIEPLKEAPRPATVTDEQIGDLARLMDGIAPAERIGFIATTVRRDISHPRELTAAEYATVVDALATREDAEGES